jgi:hypothetical protein
MKCVAAFRTMFPLGTMILIVYDSCMDDHTYTLPARDDTDHHVSDPTSLLVSEMLPTFLGLDHGTGHHRLF